MADSKNIDVCTFTIKISGNEISYRAMNISITNEMNRIPVATLTLLDDDPATLDEETTSTDLFNAGNDIEILASYGNDPQKNIFKGIIVKNSIKVTSSSATVEISCKHSAVKMTVATKDV